jgi:hypothetical protein
VGQDPCCSPGSPGPKSAPALIYKWNSCSRGSTDNYTTRFIFLGKKDNIHATISLSRMTILTCICLTKNWNHQLRHNKPNTLTGEYLLVYFRMNRYSIFCLLFRVVLAWIRCQQEWPPDSTWRQQAFHKWISKSRYKEHSWKQRVKINHGIDLLLSFDKTLPTLTSKQRSN